MRTFQALLCAIVLAVSVVAPATAKDHPNSQLDMFSARVDAATAARLRQAGYDIAASAGNADGTTTLTLILSPQERAELRKEGVRTAAVRDAKGKTSRERALEQAASGYNVWRSYDEPGGIRDEIYEIAKKNAGFVKLAVIGHSIQGREIIALKVTQGAKGTPDGKRPAAMYVSEQHAREWISVEVNRRFLRWILDQRKAENPEIVALLKSTELWFVLSANPDGYQYTFDHERLWRRNLRDNDGNGVITGADGVDPNRNFDEHWNYDNEGSSSSSSSDTYRGTAARSEPETEAMAGLLERIRPKFLVNYHSFGSWILYPQGWQVGTPDADNPIYAALAGTDANPGIPGFDPGLSSDELYITNGETTDFAETSVGAISFTPELGEGCAGCGFVFPDDEALIQAEFEKTLAFDLDVAKSATHPGNPSSHLGTTVEPFYLSQTEVDAENGALAMFDYTFDKSYGDPQEVRILAKRSLGAVTLKYRINGGAVQSRSTTEWTRGERYGPGNGTYYHVVGGTISGTAPTNSVEVWFEGGGQTSDSFTYTAVSESGDPVLIMAAEDYTGASPVQPAGGPFYLGYYQDALTANGIASDVYNVDANGRTAPDSLGILSHYDAVIWYTGDDLVTRELGWGPGNASRLALRELFEVRDYLNEGGKLLYTGKRAGQQYGTGLGIQRYDPFTNQQCSLEAISPRCRPLPGSGDNVNDVLEYWFGASLINLDAGIDPDTGEALGVTGIADPFVGTSWAFNGPDSAQNQDHNSSFITTSGLLPVADYPQFDSKAVARYDRVGGPFEPHSPTHYVYSQIADISYKRLMNTTTVPAAGGSLSFWTSYDTEIHWDHLFVEVRTVGQDDWTTLPDANGHTTQDTGESCPAGWRDLHPMLDHYQTLNADGTCSPAGSSGEWHAGTGASGGWQQWEIDLAEYAGDQIEISISYVSDWSAQGLGVFIDDIVLPNGESTSFEAGDGGWTIPGQPAGSAPNPTDFIVTTAGGFPEGAVIATDDTIYMGFGFEGITDALTREVVMGRAMEYLLP